MDINTMDEIPEMISPHSDYSSNFPSPKSVTPKNEKTMYLKELNTFFKKKDIEIFFDKNEKLTPWDYGPERL
jgi:hypothetical protein